MSKIQPLHNLPGDDATPCPITGLMVTCRPHWNNIAIAPGYSVTFKMIGSRILYSEPRGDSRELDVERLYQERELVLSEHLGAVKGYVEIRNYGAVRHRPPRLQRNQQVVRFREEGARARGFIAFHLSPLIRQLVRLGLALNQATYPFEIVEDYDTAIRHAVHLLEPEAMDAPDTPKSRSWLPEFLSQRLLIPPSKEQIDQLVTHIGGMTWDVQGNPAPDDVTTEHPLSPIYEAVALVKQDVDEMLDERDMQALQLREVARRGEDSARTQSVLMASMSQELRAPINVVLGLLDQLAHDELTTQQLSLIQAARESASASMSLLHSLLDLSELKAGKVTLEEVDFELAQVVEQAAALAAPLALVKGIDFHSRIAPRLPARLRGDPARLQQALANLAGEAIKSTEGGGVTLRVRSAGTLHGPGTAALRFEVVCLSVQGKLFSVPEQPAELPPLKGDGAGLTICRRLAELMGGELGLDRGQRQGTTYWMTAVFKDAHT